MAEMSVKAKFELNEYGKQNGSCQTQRKPCDIRKQGDRITFYDLKNIPDCQGACFLGATIISTAHPGQV
jgi:hypothetical protein